MDNVKKAIQELDQKAPGMLKQMLDDLMNAVPALKPLIMGWFSDRFSKLNSSI
jgi:hypothetical protein